MQRVAFRFCFLYLGLFCTLSQPIMGFVPLIEIYPLCAYPPVSTIVSWVATTIFRIRAPLVYVDSGSGDKVSDWIFQFTIFVVAIAGTALWSVLDRKRKTYDALGTWFRLFVRFALASQLLGYGIAKMIPDQMPFPHLTTLLEPYGNFSPMGVLWASIGSSQYYEIFAGAAEAFAGVLLIFPRTAMLGALVSAADMTQVFTLNMTYDVSVKILSFHLLLLSLYLLAPQGKRLADFFIFDRPVAASEPSRLFRGARAKSIFLVAQGVFGLYIVVTNVVSAGLGWMAYGGGAPKSALYGIWDVKTLAIDGRVRAPFVGDPGRFRRVVFDNATRVAFERMDDTFASYDATIAVPAKTITLSDATDKTWKARYAFERDGPARLRLDGIAGKHHVRMELALVDHRKFTLVSRGFHWVQDYPFHR